MAMRVLMLCVFINVFIYASAQQHLIDGVVNDINTGEALGQVSVAIEELPSIKISTSDNGEFHTRLPDGKFTFVFQHIGYKKKYVEVAVNDDRTLDIELHPSSTELKEITITAEGEGANISDPQTGVEAFSTKITNKLPVLLGERDVIKALQLFPGVSTAGEGKSGFFVRGGGIDQNLIMLDDVPLYKSSHLMGFFSVFNSDVINDVALYKGIMPAQYGGRLSSVLDVQMRSGNETDYKTSGSIGLISSKLAFEGPIRKNKSNFIVAARRTYADAIAQTTNIKEVKNTTLYFYDVNLKINLTLSDQDYLKISAFNGKDNLGLNMVMDTDWSNSFATVKWTHLINSKWLFNSYLQYNKSMNNTNLKLGKKLDARSTIDDYSFKQEFFFTPQLNNEWRFGISSTYHDIMPMKYQYAENAGTERKLKNRYSLDNALYISNKIKLTEKVEILSGLRLSAFSALGKGEYYTLDEKNNVVDSIFYNTGKFVKTYIKLEPRLSMSYRLNNISSVKMAYARNVQNMHMLENTSSNTPYDRWISSSNNTKPQIADQFSLGYFRDFYDNQFQFSVEGYYKDMRNQIDFKDNAQMDWNDDVETELLYGKGRTYGIEFLLKKQTGRLTGWIGYTLSKSEKKINGINNDRWYNARQDRTHNVSAVVIYDLSSKWSLSSSWIYYTGEAITYPSGKYDIDDRTAMYFTERNGYRAPAHHRLDIGATCILKNKKSFYSELVFSLYNVYGRANPYLIDYRMNDKDNSQIYVYQYSLFKYVPSVSWNFRF